MTNVKKIDRKFSSKGLYQLDNTNNKKKYHIIWSMYTWWASICGNNNENSYWGWREGVVINEQLIKEKRKEFILKRRKVNAYTLD